MKAELKNLHSPDIFDLQTYYPEIEDNFCFYLEFYVGLQHEQGSEQFGIIVCTPKWLLENEKDNKFIFGKDYLIIFEYSYQLIYNTIKSYIERQSGNSWEELARKISRIGYWEFEDYP